MKKLNIKKVLCGVFLAAFVIMAVCGIVGLFMVKSFIEGAVEVNGKISKIESSIDPADGETTYTAFATYTYEGETYNNIKLSSYTSSMYEGKSIELYIDKSDPQNAKVKSFIYIGPIICFGLGVVFAAVFALMLGLIVGEKNQKRKIVQNGRKVIAQVQAYVIDTTITVKSKHPYRLDCVYTDELSGQPVICRSDIVWESPEEYMGKYVAVYVDKKYPSRYVVDLNSIGNE
jgi:hypothetical protein